MPSLREMMDHLMENAFVSPRRWLTEWPVSIGVEMPEADLIEENDKYLVKIALPGWKPEDVEITYEVGMMTIKGEVREEKKEEKQRYHRREIHHTSFVRSLSLPPGVLPDKAKAKAEFDKGILTVTLPKAEEAKPKQIKINVK
jgi:HSP20 family protein